MLGPTLISLGLRVRFSQRLSGRSVDGLLISAIEIAATQMNVGTKAIKIGGLVTANGHTRLIITAAAPSHHVHLGSTPLLEPPTDSAMTGPTTWATIQANYRFLVGEASQADQHPATPPPDTDEIFIYDTFRSPVPLLSDESTAESRLATPLLMGLSPRKQLPMPGVKGRRAARRPPSPRSLTGQFATERTPGSAGSGGRDGSAPAGVPPSPCSSRS